MTPQISGLIQQNEVFRRYHAALFREGDSRKSFLDLSCGTRTDIREVVEGLGNRWVGIDQIDWPGVIKGDVHHLPFGDSEFDVVFSAGTFEHYHDPWQVGREVHRVLKPGGLFCGLIAFLQPWHGDSYYHFSHLGVRQMLTACGFEIEEIRASGAHGVSFLIRQMFPHPAAPVGQVLSFYGDVLAAIRRTAFPALIKLLHYGNREKRDKRLEFLKDDDMRFASSILFLSRKEK